MTWSLSRCLLDADWPHERDRAATRLPWNSRGLQLLEICARSHYCCARDFRYCKFGCLKCIRCHTAGRPGAAGVDSAPAVPLSCLRNSTWYPGTCPGGPRPLWDGSPMALNSDAPGNQIVVRKRFSLAWPTTVCVSKV